MKGEDIYKILVKHGVPPEDARILVATAVAESGLRADAVGDKHISWAPSVGLFQIHIPAHWDKLQKFTGVRNLEKWEEWLKEPEFNAFMAAQVYKSQGLNAWTCYRTGAYRQYLDKALEIPVRTGETEAAAGLPGKAGLRAGVETEPEAPSWIEEKLGFEWAQVLLVVIGIILLVVGILFLKKEMV